MNKIFVLSLIFLFLSNCSFQSNSKFWTKEKKIKEETKISKKRELFIKEIAPQKELNPKLKLKLGKNSKNPNKVNENNDSITNYSINLEKISKLKFSKIKNFSEYEPEIIFQKDNLIFFDNNGSILKFNKNSDLIWKKNYYSKQEKKMNPVLFFSKNEKILFIADTISRFYGINIDTGDLLWSKYNDAPFISDVKIEKNKILVIDSNNTLKCFSIKDGSLIWEYKSENSIVKSSKKISIVISGNKVLFNNSIGDINAIDINNGNLIWITPTANKQSLIQPYLLKLSDLVIQNDSILFSNNINEFFSIEINTGFINWKQKINSYIRPVAVGDLIFTVTLEGFLVIIDNSSGNIIRITNLYDKFKIKKRSQIKPIGIAIDTNEIFLSTSIGKLLVIDILTGKTKSILKIDNEKISRPFIFDKKLYLIKSDSVIKLN